MISATALGYCELLSSLILSHSLGRGSYRTRNYWATDQERLTVQDVKLDFVPVTSRLFDVVICAMGRAVSES